MSEEKEDERHRELFESPIHPLQINMVPPYADVSNKMFSLQVNGEVLWKWKDISGNPGSAFALIQRSLLPLGYQLEDTSRDRVGHALASAIRKFRTKIESITNGKKRKSLRADSWTKVGIHPEEIRQSSTDVLTQLTEEHCNLRATVEEKAAHLYSEMQKRVAHTGKDFIDVGQKQQQRQLTQVQ